MSTENCLWVKNPGSKLSYFQLSTMRQWQSARLTHAHSTLDWGVLHDDVVSLKIELAQFEINVGRRRPVTRDVGPGPPIESPQK